MVDYEDIQTRKEGKRWIQETGLTLNFVSLIFLLIGFSTPYWIISWPRVHTPFKRIGLWEACFSGLVLDTDPTQKSYHGCWWIFASEYWHIRSWIMPGWFITVQLLMVLILIAQMVGFVLNFVVWLQTGGRRTQGKQEQHQKEPIVMYQTVTVITVLSALFNGFAMLIFGLGWRFDFQWLPSPWFNYLNWSYGMCVVACLLQVFASICQITHCLIIRQELREPPQIPKLQPLKGYPQYVSKDSQI